MALLSITLVCITLAIVVASYMLQHLASANDAASQVPSPLPGAAYGFFTSVAVDGVT